MVASMAPVLTSPLVSTQWLADHLGADELVVLDASVHAAGTGTGMTWSTARDDHERLGHVPGARYADLIGDFSEPDSDLPFTRPSAERFERAAADLGVTNECTVVVYDDSVGEWAARLWWIFRSFGFDGAAVLDGGFPKWRNEGRPVRVGALTSRSARTSEHSFLAGEERPVWADRDRVLRAVDGSEPAALVLAVDDAVLGAEHPAVVPGSEQIPARRLLDPATNALLRKPALSDALAPVVASDEIVTYCGVGSAACVDALALTVLGHERVQVYDGSLADWWREPEPIAS